MKEFEVIYNTFYKRLYFFLFQKTSGNVSLTEDLVQETFYQVYISIHKYRGDSDIFTWICAISKNVYYKYMRKNKLEIVEFNDEILDSEQDTLKLIEKNEYYKSIK